MTVIEFNEKYKDYLEKGHYGLDIEDNHILEYLDRVFQDLIKIPGFQYSQIKLKFNSARFYNNLYQILPSFGGDISNNIENYISNYFKFKDIINKNIQQPYTT